MHPGNTPDYIVIGAGSSGCVVAARLSSDPSVRVLLVEAGGPAQGDAAVATPGRWVSLIGSIYDWGYATCPEPGLDGRIVGVPRGRALGGSSAINAMAYVRGHRRAFDRWRDLGNPGWGYDDLRRLFERAEQSHLEVHRCLDPHASHQAFLDAAASLGYGADPEHDFNAPEPEGTAGFYRKNIRNGRRHSAAAAYLVPALGRPNLEVLTYAQATRLIVERSRATGIEYVQDGRLERAHAAREVVLCAGAVDSPRLLMHSGIGPADHLRAHGVAVLMDGPGVGQNLHDHLKLSVRWLAHQAMPPSSVTAGLFTSSSTASGVPDLQFYVGRGLDEPGAVVTITVSHVQPASRGSVMLRSTAVSPANSGEPPMIRANYLSERSDVEALIEGMGLARAFGESAAYDRVRGPEVEPGGDTRSTAELERFVRQNADTIYHLAGTCRMGPASDVMSVVDASLRVHGLEGLRVADASIMPEPINAPTHAACIVVGEKCAELMGALSDSS